MLERLAPFQFDRTTGWGRTRPARITCESPQGEMVEVVAKLSASCDRGVSSLAIEALSACLAGDLGIPTPQPFVVELDPEWVATINDQEWKAKAQASAPAAFGSKVVGPGFPDWITGSALLGQAVQTAAAIFLFDAAIDNVDRRDGNPNCLARGAEIRIIDHELAFPDNSMLIGWRPPWVAGGLHHFENHGAHIFRAPLMRREIDWAPIKASWEGLSDEALAAYGAAMPAEWAGAAVVVEGALNRIRNVREQIDGCIAEARRVLT